MTPTKRFEAAYIAAMDEVVCAGVGAVTNIYHNLIDGSVVVDVAGKVAIIGEVDQALGEEVVRGIVRKLLEPGQ